MGALLHDRALFQHHDAVRLPHGRDAVRDQDHRAAAHDRRQVIQNALLGQRIDAGKRVVQNQDARIAQQRAGDRGALLLAARERDAALARPSSCSLPESLRYPPARPASSAARRICSWVALSTPNAMLSAMRGAEQERLLRHEADVPAQLRRIQIAQVDAIQQDRAVGGIDQPRNQADQRALARSGVTDHGHASAPAAMRKSTPSSARPLR